jgi:thioredoxin 1
MALDLNRDNYEKETSQAQGVVLVDFWGPQCRPCLALMPAVERLEKEYSGKLKVAKVNAAENRLLCAKLKVLGLPTYIFYKNGAEFKRLSGQTLSESDIRKATEELVK